jgi:hypothetical protein
LFAVIPADDPVAANERLTIEAFAGVRIASFRRSVNPYLYDALSSKLATVGGALSGAPEPSDEAIISHAQCQDMWWLANEWSHNVADLPPGRVMRPIDDPDFVMALDIAMNASVANLQARAFWDVATRRDESSSHLASPLPAAVESTPQLVEPL